MLTIITRFFVVFLIVFLAVPYSSTAESVMKEQAPVPSGASFEANGNLNCFDYYQFGSVSADVQPNILNAVRGIPLQFSGSVVNTNDYPLLDGTLYVKIFRRDETTFSAGDGHMVVDQFVVADDIVLPAQGNKKVSYEWRVPTDAALGEYYAAYFFVTNDRYNLLGLSFTDDVVGNTASFSVVGNNRTVPVELSKVDARINDINPNFAAFPPSFEYGDSVVITTTVTNTSEIDKILPLQWTQYSWDALRAENVRNIETSLVTVQSGETKTVRYEVVPQRESVVFVTAELQDRQAKSILNFRYVQDGALETRINFPGLTTFPLVAGEEVTLFACAHSTNEPLVPENVLTLTLTDSAGEVLHEYTYEGDITGAMAGFGSSFIPERNVNALTLTARLERAGVPVEEVILKYDCQLIDPDTCLLETTTTTTVEDSGKGLTVAHVMLLIVLLAVVIALTIVGFAVWRLKTRKQATAVQENAGITTNETENNNENV